MSAFNTSKYLLIEFNGVVCRTDSLFLTRLVNKVQISIKLYNKKLNCIQKTSSVEVSEITFYLYFYSFQDISVVACSIVTG